MAVELRIVGYDRREVADVAQQAEIEGSAIIVR